MTRSYAYSSLAVALALALGGCSTWQNMDRSEKGTAVGATGGAIVGAAVGGPVGAAVGAGVGGYAGHYETQPGGLASNGTGTRYGRAGGGTRYSQSSDEIRSVQQALNDQGYDAGAVDGQMGPNTQDALRRFQQAQNLPQTGEPDTRTLAALGISSQAAYRAANPVNESNPSYRVNESNRSYRANEPMRSSASSRYETQPRRTASSSNPAHGNDQRSDTIRSVQQALNDQGYDAGTVDGVMGRHTQQALREFQQAQNLRQTGRPDERTLAALGVSNETSNPPSDEAANPNEASNPGSTAADQTSDQTPTPSNPPSAAANQGSSGSSQPAESNEPNPSLNQGSNQGSNPSTSPGAAANGSTLPGAPASTDSNVSNQSNDSNPTTANSNPPATQPQ
jgi:peptidoglycan hydrolase-like protein with peptidoglycan-binding domain